MNQVEKSISRNIIFKFILNIFNLVIPVLIGPYVLRIIGPEMNGTINYAQTIYSYFYIFAGFGVYQYGLREISRVKNNPSKLNSLFTSLFIITIFTTFITSVTYLIYIYYGYNSTDMYTISIILSFNLLANIFYTEWVNEALENFDFITIKTVVIRFVYIIAIFLFVRVADDFKHYVILLVVSTFANNIISFLYIKRTVKFSFENINLLPHFKPLFLVVILSNANVLYAQLDKAMLGSYYNMTSVGFYAVAQSISGIINSLLLTVITVSMPRLSHLLTKQDKTAYLKLLNKISKIYYLVLFPTCIGLLILSREVILLYGGSDFLSAYPILIVFSLYTISLGYETILGTQVLYLNKKESIQVKFIFICGVFNLILNIFLVLMNHFNGVTAISTTLISNMILIWLEYYYINFKLNLKVKVFSIDKLKYLFYSLIFIPITFIIKIVLFSDLNESMVSLIVYSLTAVIVNAIAYIILLFLTKDEILFEIFTMLKVKLSSNK